ncbi:MAG: TolC family protein [Bacteroidia bacterium]|nr:TolC family protein [Bacteroidia bacterium]
MMKNPINSIIICLGFLIVSGGEIYSQISENENHPQVMLPEYLSKVANSNLSYLAEQFNLSITEAQLKSAKVFNDPELSVSYSNNEDWKIEMGKSIETGLSYDINLGNKRRAGINLAKSQFDLSRLELDEFFRNLKANASFVFFEALKNKKLYELKENTYSMMHNLATSDSIRFSSGEITKIDAMQSALEAKSQMNELLEARKDYQNSLVILALMQGEKPTGLLKIPTGDFSFSDSIAYLPELIKNALENRAAIMIAVKNNEISERSLQLIKAERVPVIRLEAGYAHNYIVRNEIAPAPACNSYSAGISVPLKFSVINKGTIEAAKFDIEKNKISLQEVELEISSEVAQAYNNFISQNDKMQHYNKGLIDDAKQILEGRIYSYKRGENSLIEVINAQKTFNELQQDYYETMFGYASSIIELERVSGETLIKN